MRVSFIIIINKCPFGVNCIHYLLRWRCSFIAWFHATVDVREPNDEEKVVAAVAAAEEVVVDVKQQ